MGGPDTNRLPEIEWFRYKPKAGDPDYPQYFALQRWFNVNRGKVTRPGSPIRLPAAPPNPSRKQ